MKKTSLFLVLVLLAGLFTAPAYAAASEDFTDIKDHWAFESIEKLVGMGIMNGTSKDCFSPDETLNRAMYVTILGRYYESIFDELEVQNDSFSDTERNSWYSKYVFWAVDAEIINGIGNNKFDPYSAITREQGMAILYRFTDYLFFEFPPSEDSVLTKYNDDSHVDKWALDSAIWAEQKGLLSWVDDTRLLPKQSLTRAETAALMDRYFTVYEIESISHYESQYFMTMPQGYPGWLVKFESGDMDFRAHFHIYYDGLEYLPLRGVINIPQGETCFVGGSLRGDSLNLEEKRLYVGITGAHGAKPNSKVTILISREPFRFVQEGAISGLY